MVGTHKLGYIPNGYKLMDTKTSEKYEKYIFSNGTNEISLRIMSSGISEVGVDSENRTMRSIEVKDYVAYALLHSSSDEPAIVIRMVFSMKKVLNCKKTVAMLSLLLAFSLYIGCTCIGCTADIENNYISELDNESSDFGIPDGLDEKTVNIPVAGTENSEWSCVLDRRTETIQFTHSDNRSFSLSCGTNITYK